MFHPVNLMVTLFNPIERLSKLVVSAKILCTEQQILDVGVTVIRNAGDFERALGK